MPSEPMIIYALILGKKLYGTYTELDEGLQMVKILQGKYQKHMVGLYLATLRYDTGNLLSQEREVQKVDYT